MRYCSKCGREVSEEEYIDSYGYCIDCFLKYRGIFREKPVLKITICPRCGSWRLHGEWYRPTSLEEIIRRTFLAEERKFIDHHVSIIDVSVSENHVKLYKNRYLVEAEFTVLINNSVTRITRDKIEYIIEKKPCPKCIARSGKSHKAFIQVRSERGKLSDHEKRLVMKIVSEPSISEEVVEISENKYGIDIKVLSIQIAKKIASQIVKHTGAKITESFKPTKYNPRRGSWTGISTLSVRIPSIEKGDLVEYDGRPAVVKRIDSHGIYIEFLDDGSSLSIDYESYWHGVLRKQGYMVYYRKYRVIAHDHSTLYLLDEDRGEMREYPITSYSRDISDGDIVYIVKIKNRDYIVKTI